MLTHKNIDAAREARLWIGQVIVPAVTAGLILVANPNVRRWAHDKCENIKGTFKKNKTTNYKY